MAAFVRKGRSKIYWVPVVSGFPGAGPTTVELAAGTDLSPYLAETNGFEFKSTFVDAPNFGSRLTPKISGEDSLSDPSLTFYDDDAVAALAVRTLMAKDATGYIVRMPYGRTAAKRSDTWLVTSTGPNDEYKADNSPAKYTVSFSVGVEPNMNTVNPAV